MMSGNATKKTRRNPHEKVFIVNESYAGKRNLSDIFADLLYSAYCKREPDNMGDNKNQDGLMPDPTGQKDCAAV